MSGAGREATGAGGAGGGRAARAAAAALFFAGALFAAILLGARAVRTPDAFFHWTVGKAIAASGEVPRANVYLAFDRDRPFVDVEWGWQVVAAAVRDRAGLLGVLALRELLVLAAAAAVYLAARRAGLAAAALATLAFLATAESRFLDAPEMASIALTAIFVAILEHRDAHPRALFALPPLVVLWANVHGFHVVGLALIAAYALGDLVHERRPRGARLLLVLLAALIAPLLNPYGVEGALGPLRAISHGATRALLSERIIELRSPLTDPVLAASATARAFQITAAVAALAVLASLAEALFGRRSSRAEEPARFRLERAIAVGLAIAIAAPYIRNVGLFAAIAAPLGALAAGGVLERLPRRALVALPGLCGVALGILGLRVATGADERNSLEPVGVGPRIAAPIDHSRAIAFYRAQGLPAVVWNEFGTGHALIAEGGGAIRPAICGETHLYAPEFLAAYGEALTRKGGLERLLERYPADALFLDHRRLEGSELLAEAISGFALVYLDARDAIFVRKGARAALDLGAADLERDLGDPVRDRLALSSFLLAAGAPERAEALAAKAKALRPDWAPADYILGVAARDRGDLDEAKAHLRRALSALPDAADIRSKLGQIHLRLHEFGRAEEELRAAARLDPGTPAYRENLRAFLTARGRAGEAAAVPYRAEDAEDWCAGGYVNLGNLFFRSGRLADAVLWYRRAVQAAPRDAGARFDLGVALRDQGRREEADETFREVLEIAPDHAAARAALGMARHGDRRDAGGGGREGGK